MRPILVELPSFWLFVTLVMLAVGALVRDWRGLRHRGRIPATPLFFAGSAALLWSARGGSWLPLPVYSYATMLWCSLVAGWFVTLRLARDDGIAPRDAASLYLWTTVWSMVGARALFVLTNLGAFRSLREVLEVWNGGLVAYGGMLGGFVASLVLCRRRAIPLLRWADAAVPAVGLGTALTRLGCLLYGCDFGQRSELPWAIRFPNGSPAWLHHHAAFGLPADARWSFPVHPTQLYELLTGLFLFAGLLALRRFRRFSGEVFVAWVVGYGILRPIIEVFRDDEDRGSVGPLSTSQFIGIVSVVFAGALWVWLARGHASRDAIAPQP